MTDIGAPLVSRAGVLANDPPKPDRFGSSSPAMTLEGHGSACSDAALKAPNGFVWLMLLLSTVGFAVVPLITPVWWSGAGTTALYAWLTYLTGMHIGLSYFFYADRDARPVIRVQWRRFLVAPPLVLAGFFLLFMMTDKGTRGLAWIAIGMWTIWHFQRQNLGIYALVAVARGEPPMSAGERRVIVWSGIAGMVLNAVGYRDGLQDAGLGLLAPWLNAGGLALQILVSAAALGIVGRSRGIPPVRAAFLLVFALNWSTFLFLPYAVAWIASGFGHGLQYVALMLSLGAGSRNTVGFTRLPARIAPAVNAAVVFAIGLAGFEFARRAPGWFPPRYGSEAINNGLAGLSFAVTGIHYVLDAGLWRLSRSEARGYMRKKLGFLFAG